jgi:ATP-dependent protease ClpP protease subunit
MAKAIALPDRSAFRTPRSALPAGLRIEAAAGKDPEILIYSDIGPAWAGMIDADSVVRALQSLPAGHRRVVVRINSPGGDVFEAFGIYNALARHLAEVIVEIDALAASAASIVAMAGDKIRIAANAMVMIHNAWTIAAGDEHELAKVVEVLHKVGLTLADTYAARTGQSLDDVIAMLDAETWMTAEEAVEKGFADELGQELQVAASVPEGRFKNTPERLKGMRGPNLAAERGARSEVIDPPASHLRERIALVRRRLGV